MSDHSNLPSRAVPALKMRDVHCVEMEFDLEIPLDKFDLAAFTSQIGAPDEQKRDGRVCNTRDSTSADYHVHFRWQVSDEKAAINIHAEYVARPLDPEPGEREPFAEDLMAWLARFVKFPDVSARIAATFSYKGGARLGILPLPMKMLIPALNIEAEIDGIAVKLPSQPSGVVRVSATQRPKGVFLSFEAERRLALSSFSLSEHLELSSEFAKKLVTQGVEA